MVKLFRKRWEWRKGAVEGGKNGRRWVERLLEEEKVLGWAGLCGNRSSVTECEAADESKGTLGPSVSEAWSGFGGTEGGLCYCCTARGIVDDGWKVGLARCLRWSAPWVRRPHRYCTHGYCFSSCGNPFSIVRGMMNFTMLIHSRLANKKVTVTQGAY